VVPNVSGAGNVGLVEKPDAHDAPSNLASIGRYVLTPDIFNTLRGLKAGSGGEIQLVDAINIHAQQGSVDIVRQNGRRFDCGSVDGYVSAVVSEYINALRKGSIHSKYYVVKTANTSKQSQHLTIHQRA
jgi:UTP--glucose-1-phosphate uridylyltransferase